MKNQEEFNHLIERLKQAGFKIPAFRYESIPDGEWYISEVINNDMRDLGLEVYLSIGFNLSKLKETLTLEDFSSGLIKLSATRFVSYQSLYSKEFTIDIDPSECKTLVDKVEKELKILKELEYALPKNEGMVAARNSLAFLDENKSWGEFYGDLVRQGNLRWFDSRGKKFPYVVTTSDVLGDVGRSEGGLHFVSTDIANEPWKEQVVAYHERFCQDKSHKYALRKEAELAKKLGVEKEHREWRESIKDLWKNGSFGGYLK